MLFRQELTGFRTHVRPWNPPKASQPMDVFNHYNLTNANPVRVNEGLILAKMTRGLKKSVQVSKELTATAVTRLSGFFFFFFFFHTT